MHTWMPKKHKLETLVVQKFPHPSNGRLLQTVVGSRAHCLGANGSSCQLPFRHLHNAQAAPPHHLWRSEQTRATRTRLAMPRSTRELRNLCKTSRKRRTRRRGSAGGYHLARRQRDRHLKRRSSSRRTWELRRRAAPATQVPAARQWHLITSALPPLHHLDRLPSHFWLCWSNLASPRLRTAPLNVHLENFSRRSFRRDWRLGCSAENH